MQKRQETTREADESEVTSQEGASFYSTAVVCKGVDGGMWVGESKQRGLSDFLRRSNEVASLSLSGCSSVSRPKTPGGDKTLRFALPGAVHPLAGWLAVPGPAASSAPHCVNRPSSSLAGWLTRGIDTERLSRASFVLLLRHVLCVSFQQYTTAFTAYTDESGVAKIHKNERHSKNPG